MLHLITARPHYTNIIACCTDANNGLVNEFATGNLHLFLWVLCVCASVYECFITTKSAETHSNKLRYLIKILKHSLIQLVHN